MGFKCLSILFQDNIHAGNFVRHLIDLLKEGRVPGITAEEQKSLFVQNDDPEDERSVNKLVSFCDLAVYTKNRNFRLFLSTKFTKNVPLILSDTNKHVSDSKVIYTYSHWFDLIIIKFKSFIGMFQPGRGHFPIFTHQLFSIGYWTAFVFRWE